MITAIIQARTGSTRMPGKTMAAIAEKPLLQYCVSRTMSAKSIEKIVVATTNLSHDNRIANWCRKNNVLVYRGSESDVLDRYYRAASVYGATIIVRVTSDCPFVDPEIIDMMVGKIFSSGSDYVSNRVTHRTWPHGLDIEVFTFSALQRAWKESVSPREREHVTPYIWEHPDRFSLIELPLTGRDLSNIRLTVDYPEDFLLVKELIEKYHADCLPWKRIVEVIHQHPEIQMINANRADNTLK